MTKATKTAAIAWREEMLSVPLTGTAGMTSSELREALRDHETQRKAFRAQIARLSALPDDASDADVRTAAAS